MTEETLREIEDRAKRGFVMACDIAQFPGKIRMSIPADPEDTDLLLGRICEQDIPALTCEVQNLRESLQRVVSLADQVTLYLPHDPVYPRLADQLQAALRLARIALNE